MILAYRILKYAEYFGTAWANIPDMAMLDILKVTSDRQFAEIIYEFGPDTTSHFSIVAHVWSLSRGCRGRKSV